MDYDIPTHMSMHARFYTVFFILGLSVLFTYCTNDQTAAIQTPLQVTYIPFGDSYTIGEGVAENDRWPNQLADQLQKQANITVKILDNPSRNGYKTQDVLTKELRVLDQHQPDLITLLIGANDHYQQVPILTFENNFIKILKTIQTKAPHAKVLIINIPDYSRTLLGRRIGNGAMVSDSIQAMNQVIQKHADALNLPVVNIFNVSQSLGNQVVADGLHPSTKQYATWVKEILPAATQLLR